MTTDLDALLADLAARDILIEAHGDRLKIDAPVGAVTPDLRAALTEHKLAILARLAGSAEPAAELPPEIVRIPLGWGPWAPEHGGDDLHDWLVAHGLHVVGGTSHFGGTFRPMLYLADGTAAREDAA
jgi:hypothetical protein